MAGAKETIILGGSLDGYSRIFKGKMPNDGREVAIKRVISGTTDINEVNKLIELSKHKQHEHVIRYFILEASDPYYFIYLELCSGTLRDFVEDPSFDRGGLDEKTAVKQIALGLEHIHRNGIYHLDLKPSNILVSYGSPKRLVLADFEVSKKVYDEKESIRTRTFLGTIGWIAPEIEYFHDCEKRLTRKADVFSFGLLLYYILTHGSHPFCDELKIDPDKLDDAQKRIKDYRTAKPGEGLELKGVSESNQNGVLARDLLFHLLGKTPESRPDARDVVQHPFFWSAYRQYQFYKQVGDCTESLRSVNQTFDASQRLRVRLDQDRQKVVHGNWLNKLHPTIRPHLINYQKPVKGSKRCEIGAEHISELVKVIRNYWVHFVKSNPDIADLGPLPSYDGTDDNVHTSLDSLTKEFPQLLLHTYTAALPWRDDEKLQEFYPECDFPKFQELQNDNRQQTFESNWIFLEIVATGEFDAHPYGAGRRRPCVLDVCINNKDELVLLTDEKGKGLVRMTKNGKYLGTVVGLQDIAHSKNVTFNHVRGEIIISESNRNHVAIHDCTTGDITIVTQANGRNFQKPHGIAVNNRGETFVCDTGNNRIVMLDRDGQFEIGEKDFGPEQMENCYNLAFDKQDNIFVTDRGKQRIQVFSKDGDIIRCIGPHLTDEHSFEECWGIAVYENYIVVSDSYGDKVHLITTAGEHMCCIGNFDHPSGVIHVQNGIFYVCDTNKRRIVKLELRLKSMPSPTAGTNPARSDVRWKRRPKEDTDVSWT